jgi:hypothetical protein
MGNKDVLISLYIVLPFIVLLVIFIIDEVIEGRKEAKQKKDCEEMGEEYSWITW